MVGVLYLRGWTLVAAVLLVAEVVLNISVDIKLCHTVRPSFYFRHFQFPASFPPFSAISAGMDCTPDLDTRGSYHPPTAPHSLSWARSCTCPCPELCVSLLDLSHLPQASSPLLPFPP